MAYRFVATGNFVDFYDGSMHVIKLHNTSRCVTWIFDNTPGLNFKIDEMIYHTDSIGEISFNDVACTTQADFVTGIIEMFPALEGGSGGGGGDIEISATFSAITASVETRFVYVLADETNNGDISLYVHNGTTLKFLQTIA